MTKAIILLLSCWLSGHLIAQRPYLSVSPDQPLDSVLLDIYQLDYPDPAEDKYGIAYTRSFGWLALSDKFNTDSFYQWTKLQCIKKVGEDYFYQHFKLNGSSFKNDKASEIYTITYIIMPFRGDNSMIPFSFKRLDFLAYSETQIPANLPDCQSDPTLCNFLFDREKVQTLVREKIIGAYKIISAPYLQLLSDFNWQISVELENAGIKQCKVDCRTGIMSEIKTSWRID